MSDYFGHPTESFKNPYFQVDIVKDAGPRVARFIPAGSDENLLAEVGGGAFETPWGPYHFLGGHRLWHGPEQAPRSYHPDNDPIRLTVEGNEVLMEAPVETHTGIRKGMRLVISADKPVMTVEHLLTNDGVWAVELAPWAISQMKLGGVGIIPMRKPNAPNGFLPDRQMALWPYDDFADQRLHFINDYILVDGAADVPFKIGAYDPCGWVAYHYQSYLFVKHFEPLGNQLKYADMGCNAEIWVGDALIEIETQAPMTVIQPGETIMHTETWELVQLGAANMDVEDAIEKAGLLK
jgi:hypothetical protein